MRWRPGGLCSVLLLSAVLASSRGAGAQDSAPIEDARWAFTEGSSHFEGKRYEQAFVSFQRSQAVVQSPNTLLMIARCERELGRKGDAVVTFERALAEAKRRVGLGEAKYAPTADAAADEGQRLRAALGTLRVRVEGDGATVRVDGRALPLVGGEAVVWRDPGAVTVDFVAASGAKQRQSATLSAGASVAMTFSAEGASTVAAPPPLEAAPVQRSRGAWAEPAAIVAGGVALAGLGLFVGFGSASKSTYDRLDARCGPNRCGPADRAEADRGAQQQLLANVSVGVAVTAAVATVIFTVLALDARGRPAAARP